VNQSELKIRGIFLCAALLAFVGAVANLHPWLPGEPIRWPALGATLGALVVAMAEGLGKHKVAVSAPARLLVSVLIGACTLLSLEP
jgi:hypothetical protein